VAGWLGDRLTKTHLLAAGYGTAAAMAFCLVALPLGLATLAVVFVLRGIHAAMAETLEDTLCAELTDETQHGMAFGVLATVNGVGDFLSSVVVGGLWSAFGARVGFGYSFVLFVVGALLVWRLGRGKPVSA